MCTVCGGAEGSLTTECPETRMTEEQEQNVYSLGWNFVNGQWTYPDQE